MENKFVKYYCFLVSLIGNKMVTTKELYDLVDQTDNHFKESGYPGKQCKVINNLSRMLGDKMTSIEDTETKRRGRGTAKIFNLTGDTEAICKLIANHYSKSTSGSVKISPATEKEKKVTESDEGLVKKFGTAPQKKLSMRVYKILKKVKQNPSSCIRFDELPRVSGCPRVTKTTWKTWVKKMNEHGILISYSLNPIIDGSMRGSLHSLSITNIDSTLLSLGRKMKEWYGIEVDVKKDLGLTTKKDEKKVEEEVQKIEVKRSDTPREKKYSAGVGGSASTISRIPRSILTQDQKNYAIYMISALIKRSNFRALDIDDAGKFLRETLGFSWMRLNDIVDLIKDEEELQLGSTRRTITMKSGEKSWQELKEKYSGFEVTTIFVRLGMTKEELETLRFLKVDVESKISERDNIFAIYIRKGSRIDFRKLVTLYSSFRGEDCILGNPDLVQELKKQVLADQKLVKSYDPIYQLEKI